MVTGKNNPAPKTPAEICRTVKRRAEAIRETLIGIYGNPGPKGSPYRMEWPENVREAAYRANCRLNEWLLVEFGELHSELGLGAVVLGAKCEHEE